MSEECSVENPIDSVIDSIEQLYQIFYRKLGNVPGFRFTPSSKEMLLMLNFISLINQRYGILGIGKDYMYNYFVFQLDYWAGLDTRFGQKIPLSWIIGKKAFDRWHDRIEHDLWHAHQTAGKYKIHKGLIREKSRQYDPLEIIESEEIERQRFLNHPEGLINCNDNTSLFNHKSNSCSSCIWKSECMRILKKELPKVYILRGYLKNEKNRTKEQ